MSLLQTAPTREDADAVFELRIKIAELERSLKSKGDAYKCAMAAAEGAAEANAALTQRVNQQTRLISKLVSQLRDYRNSHHSEHPSQEGKEVCSYSWCANATRLIGESARQDVQPCGCQGSRCEGWCEVNLGEDTSNEVKQEK